MLTTKIRQGIVYLATAAFFCVAIAAQMQGATGLDVYMKAGAACLILVAGGLALVHILDDAATRAARQGQTQVEGGQVAAVSGEPTAQGQG